MSGIRAYFTDLDCERSLLGGLMALLEFLGSNGRQLGVGVLRGNDDTRTANVLLWPDVQDDAPSNRDTLGRSVLTGPGVGFSEQIAMTRIKKEIDVGTLRDETDEAAAIPGMPLVYKDLDIALTSQG